MQILANFSKKLGWFLYMKKLYALTSLFEGYCFSLTTNFTATRLCCFQPNRLFSGFLTFCGWWFWKGRSWLDWVDIFSIFTVPNVKFWTVLLKNWASFRILELKGLAYWAGVRIECRVCWKMSGDTVILTYSARQYIQSHKVDSLFFL